MQTKLHELVSTLMPEQEIIVVGFDSGDTYIRNRKARSASYLLEYNERLRDSKVCLIETDIYNSIVCVHVRKDNEKR